MTTVTIIDDHKILLQSLEQALSRSGEVLVMNVGHSIAECRALLADRLPDVLILDIGLPDGDGCDLCKELVKTYPKLKILMLTTYAEIAVITRALDAGALGYVLKNSNIEEFLEGIRTVASGRHFLCDVAETSLNINVEKKIQLTKREKDLLALIVSGHTNHDIAEKMYISEQTVKVHRKNLHRKLNVSNTAQLVRMAVNMKLVGLK